MENKYTAADYVHFDKVPIKRALISVSDKTGLVELTKALAASGVEIVSTGSTAKVISEAKIPVTEVSAVTGFQETLDGRVKTLHPAIHAGLLADMRLTGHRSELEKLGVSAFQLVVVNLYPFVEAIANVLGVSNYKVKEIGIRAGEKIHEHIKSDHISCIRSDRSPKYTMDELIELVKPTVLKYLSEIDV
jgi:AICAR transformylase/IMP cyclohydrolase PurH